MNYPGKRNLPPKHPKKIMASVTSLGVHKPSAISYMVTEGLLPPDPSEDLYSWKVLPDEAVNGDERDTEPEEEILFTDHCVVWSRGTVIQRVFRFELEGEAVTQAIFTKFHDSGTSKTTELAASCKKSEPYSHGSIIEAEPQQEQFRTFPLRERSGILNHETSGDERQRYLWAHTPEKRTCSSYFPGRALVVILTTQAHVHFLSGASHIVHLPFEVDIAFPCPQGLLLQRKVYKDKVGSETPKITSVPPNSFASTNLGFQSPVQSLKMHTRLRDPPTSTGLKSHSIFSSGDLQNLSKGGTETRLPRFFTMRDPLAELGIVAEVSLSAVGDLQTHQEAVGVHLSDFPDLREDLLYISPNDELQDCRRGPSLPAPCILAVTQNLETSSMTVWAVEDTYARPGFYSHGRHHLQSGSRYSRRKSSYGQGIGTGATTPVFRGHIGGREIGGVPTLRRQASIDDILTDSFPKAVDELASNLDPGKSSRRISSLLARADLSTSHDISAFTELASGHGGISGSRRGPSLDLRGSRPKLESDGRSTDFLLARSSNNIGSVTDSSHYHQPSISDEMDTKELVDKSTNVERVDLCESVRGLRKEIIFTKLQSIPMIGRSSPSKSSWSREHRRFKIFTLKPLHNRSVDNIQLIIFLCIVDRILSELSIIDINVRFLSTEGISKSNQAKEVGSEIPADRHKMTITHIKTLTKVIDACRIKDGNHRQLLVISESRDGMPELLLQAPSGTSFKIKIPPRFIIHHPFQLGIHSSRREQCEGGLRRVLSVGARDFVALDHEGNNGRVDIVDKDRGRHRIEIQLLPYNQLIRKMIRVSDFVLCELQSDGEAILRSWWNVASWLLTFQEEIADIEWTAIIIVLFSLAIGFPEDRRRGNTENMPRQKRRKDGLLRSSSGANTDLEKWETMLNEGNACATTFPGMQDAAWRWTMNQNCKFTRSHISSPKRSDSSKFRTTSALNSIPTTPKSSYFIECLTLTRNFLRSLAQAISDEQDGFISSALAGNPPSQKAALAMVLIALHLLREEYKLNILATNEIEKLAPLLAQIGGWLGWNSWGFGNKSFYFLESARVSTYLYDSSIQFQGTGPPEPFSPPSVLRLVENTHLGAHIQPLITLADIGNPYRLSLGNNINRTLATDMFILTPRTLAITNFLAVYTQISPEAQVEYAAASGINNSILETLPESIAVIFRAPMSSCQVRPVKSWDMCILKAIGRDDIGQLELGKNVAQPFMRPGIMYSGEMVRDVHSICTSSFDVDLVGICDGSTEADRQAITRMIFKDDQRFAEATRLVHPLNNPIAWCAPEPHWSDTELLEAQQELVKVVATRTLSVSLGRGLIFYSSRVPLLTEKLPIHGFTLSCVMKPANTTVTADRNSYSEEKVSWAFFHAGVEAGLRISKSAAGIDTSWILFNKPHEFKNRHAGFLFALGLNGHLKSIAKWVAFKYLTPKHTMTSIGLLLGLSASYLGTMDTLITRLLSVHVTRMLPPGAAELNISPLTQTSGVMGIGILYCNSQHRRMSEIMLSEMENIEIRDISSPLDTLRDEGYRLAAGFALGYINLGRGQDLKGLHDMRIVERLLALAVGTRKVNVVHILDKATAAAVVAIALIFMKTQDAILAQKIDIPNTIHQFDYVRPDIFLLRTVARHLIMWEDIQPTSLWMRNQLPSVYQPMSNLTGIHYLNSADMPLLNIVAGLCLSIGLRFAGSGGSGGSGIRNLLCHYLDQFMRIYKFPTLNYDGKLARITVRCCLDTVALATACVMAGTGDLVVFRRLRSLHGRTDVDTPYGSHLAAHLAIGVLFLGGGTHTFGTSNVAVASLLCAFYPLFPNTVLDNKSHLQAFRHFWVLATEPRCLIARDADTHQPIPLVVRLILRTGEESVMTAPCLLPEIETIATVHTSDSEYWPVTLDLINKSNHRDAFKRHQSIYVRRRSAFDAPGSVFSSTMRALNDSQTVIQFDRQTFCWIFSLSIFANFDQPERALVLPSHTPATLGKAVRVTLVDDRLVLATSFVSRGRSERLWNLRNLLAWAEGLNHRGEQLAWIGKEVVGGLRTKLEMKIRADKKK